MSATGWVFGLMALLTMAVLIITIIYYIQVKKGKWGKQNCCDSSSSTTYVCPIALTTGPTGCFVLSERTGCDTFLLTMDEQESSCDPCAPPLVCPRGVLSVKKPLPLNELILTANTATGTVITDIWAQVVPACKSKKARLSDFPGQTGCSVDLDIGYTHFVFTCTGGTNLQSVTLPLPTGFSGCSAFLSVVVNVADTCGSPLIVDQLTIEGSVVPHGNKCCPKPVLVPNSCNQPQPNVAWIKIPKCCKNPR